MSHIGFIGLGMMGSAMVRRLLENGHDVSVWNRTDEKCRPFAAEGARVASSLDDLCASHDLIVSMLSTSDVVADIAATVRTSSAKGSVHVDMSTISPETSAVCAREAEAHGRVFVHAPVLGSVPQVEEGSLLIFAGGPDAALDKAIPMLHTLGKKIYRFSGVAEATHLKLVCNFFIASMITTLGQGLSYADRAGLDGSVLLDVLASSALGAPMYAGKGKSILDGKFAPRFFLDHMLKDVRLFAGASRGMGKDLPFVQILEDLFAQAALKGYGREDYSSVVKVI